MLYAVQFPNMEKLCSIIVAVNTSCTMFLSLTFLLENMKKNEMSLLSAFVFISLTWLQFMYYLHGFKETETCKTYCK